MFLFGGEMRLCDWKICGLFLSWNRMIVLIDVGFLSGLIGCLGGDVGF